MVILISLTQREIQIALQLSREEKAGHSPQVSRPSRVCMPSILDGLSRDSNQRQS